MTVRKSENLLRGDRTPAYVSRETGAAELQISPDTWDQWVKEGRLPPACDGFPSGAPRWRWEDTQLASRSIRRPPAHEFVYFVSDGEFLKIGYSANWRKRIRALQAANPRPISIIAVFHGKMEDEATLHQRFAAQRVRPNNEWFVHCAAISEYLLERRHECVKDVEIVS